MGRTVRHRFTNRECTLQTVHEGDVGDDMHEISQEICNQSSRRFKEEEFRRSSHGGLLSTTVERPKSKVYAVKMTKVKCKDCYNVGHVPILHVYVGSGQDTSLSRRRQRPTDNDLDSSEGTPSRTKIDSPCMRCCVCGVGILSTPRGIGSRFHLQARALLKAGLLDPRERSRAIELKRESRPV